MLKVINGGFEPTRGSKFSAAIDLYAREDVVIGAGETVLVPLGVKIDESELYQIFMRHFGMIHDEEDYIHFKQSHQLNLHIRSSMSAKHGLIIANGTGVIDLDYEGEIMICLHNPIKSTDLKVGGYGHIFINDDVGDIVIEKGQKIAQISLVEHKTYLLGVDTNDKRNGGFGSSGK